jgi:hypothetical protein
MGPLIMIALGLALYAASWVIAPCSEAMTAAPFVREVTLEDLRGGPIDAMIGIEHMAAVSAAATGTANFGF